MILLDTDHTTHLKYPDSERGRRLIERMTRLGTIGQVRTTYKYADRDDPIGQSTEEENRTAGLDDNGALQYTPDAVTVQHHRFEYKYDAHGNWTERIASTHIDRRLITYHISS